MQMTTNACAKKNPNFKENFPKQGKAWQENTRIFARR
jgi:hypothetical protein